MKFNKSLLVIFLIVCLFSIASVSAADDTAMTLEEDANIIGDSDDSLSTTLEEDTNAIEDSYDTLSTPSQEEIIDDSLSTPSQEEIIENINTEEEEDILTASQEETLTASYVDDGTFTALQKKIDDAAAGSTITLSKDYTYDEGFSKRGIVINKSITINGNGHTLNGLSKARIFLVKFGLIKNNTIVLNKIKFINGNTDLYGGAIFNYANLTVKNCAFTNNRAKYCGGAINSVGHLNLQNSKFVKNVAGGDGGAVLTFSIDKSDDFFRNIYKDETPEGNMEYIFNLIVNMTLKYGTDNIKDCGFTNNTAKGRGGGAIYGFTHLNINSCRFNSNKAKEHGGAVFANKNLVIKNSKFAYNKVSKNGGAVYFRCHEHTGSYVNKKWVPRIKYYSANIVSSAFARNSAKKGGAIYGFIDDSSDRKRLRVQKCTFTNNRASKSRDVYGGIVSNSENNYIKLTSKPVVIKQSTNKAFVFVKLTQGKKLLKNKKVTFTFRGRNYTAKTNAKGIAKIIIAKNVLKKIRVGAKAIIKISYLNKAIKTTLRRKK